MHRCPRSCGEYDQRSGNVVLWVRGTVERDRSIRQQLFDFVANGVVGEPVQVFDSAKHAVVVAIDACAEKRCERESRQFCRFKEFPIGFEMIDDRRSLHRASLMTSISGAILIMAGAVLIAAGVIATAIMQAASNLGDVGKNGDAVEP